MSETVTRKSAPLTAWHLTDQAALLAALGDIMGDEWRGAISHTGTGWRLELNADNPARQVVAAVGEWLVQDFELRKFSDAEISDYYDVVDGS